MDTESLARIFDDTVNTFINIASELPTARSPGDAIDIFFQEDRRIHVGIGIIAVAVFLSILSS